MSVLNKPLFTADVFYGRPLIEFGISEAGLLVIKCVRFPMLFFRIIAEFIMIMVIVRFFARFLTFVNKFEYFLYCLLTKFEM